MSGDTDNLRVPRQETDGTIFSESRFEAKGWGWRLRTRHHLKKPGKGISWEQVEQVRGPRDAGGMVDSGVCLRALVCSEPSIDKGESMCTGRQEQG